MFLCGSDRRGQHVVIEFLNYISDAFDERQLALIAEWSTAAEGRDE